MYLDPQSTVAGVSAVRLRDFLKRWQRHDWSADTIAEYMSIDSAAARTLIAELLHSGLIKPSQDNRETYRNTLAGNRLANASAAKSLTRATAERKMIELLDRVRQVNENPYYLYAVTRVRVFGSYLTPADRLNDIDLVIEIAPKEQDAGVKRECDKQRIDEAFRAGRRFGNIVDELFWPQNEVLLYLKARSRAYSFHSADDAILDSVEVRTLFEQSASEPPVRQG